MKVHELLATPDKWTQDKGFRDEDGETVFLEDAVCWCLYVAVPICYPDWIDQGEIYRKLRARVGESIVAWNDAPERTHAEVLALCKELDI